MFKKKGKENGEVFKTSDLHNKLRSVGMSIKHVQEHFSKKKRMTWDEVDGLMKKLGYRDRVVDVIGYPPSMRKELDAKTKEENQMLKIEEEKRRTKNKEVFNSSIVDHLGTVMSEKAKANKGLKVDRYEKAPKIDQKAFTERVKIDRKPKVVNEAADWLKSVPTETQRAKSIAEEVEKEVSLEELFRSKTK